MYVNVSATCTDTPVVNPRVNDHGDIRIDFHYGDAYLAMSLEEASNIANALADAVESARASRRKEPPEDPSGRQSWHPREPKGGG